MALLKFCQLRHTSLIGRAVSAVAIVTDPHVHGRFRLWNLDLGVRAGFTLSDHLAELLAEDGSNGRITYQQVKCGPPAKRTDRPEEDVHIAAVGPTHGKSMSFPKRRTDRSPVRRGWSIWECGWSHCNERRVIYAVESSTHRSGGKA